MRLAGDGAAKTRLLQENSPLIKCVVKRFRGRGVEYDDLYQLGSIGMLKAIEHFSPQYGVKFSTYAVPMIVGEIKRYLRDDGLIKVSRLIKALAYKIAYFIDDYKSTHDKSPEISEIASALGVEPQEVAFAMDAAKAPLSIYDKGGGRQRPIAHGKTFRRRRQRRQIGQNNHTRRHTRP